MVQFPLHLAPTPTQQHCTLEQGWRVALSPVLAGLATVHGNLAFRWRPYFPSTASRKSRRRWHGSASQGRPPGSINYDIGVEADRHARLGVLLAEVWRDGEPMSLAVRLHDQPERPLSRGAFGQSPRPSTSGCRGPRRCPSAMASSAIRRRAACSPGLTLVAWRLISPAPLRGGIFVGSRLPAGAFRRGRRATRSASRRIVTRMTWGAPCGGGVNSRVSLPAEVCLRRCAGRLLPRGPMDRLSRGCQGRWRWQLRWQPLLPSSARLYRALSGGMASH